MLDLWRTPSKVSKQIYYPFCNNHIFLTSFLKSTLILKESKQVYKVGKSIKGMAINN